jgi:transcription-repair coupling factor (superfamily II helicase)
MRIAKRSAVPAKGWGEATRDFVGPWSFVQRMYQALRMYRQRRRIEVFEKELAKKYGPIPDDVKAQIERIEWPK